jgi:hypothetical protein
VKEILEVLGSTEYSWKHPTVFSSFINFKGSVREEVITFYGNFRQMGVVDKAEFQNVLKIES